MGQIGHIVDLVRAVADGLLGLEQLDVQRRLPEGKADGGPHMHRAALQLPAAEGHGGGVDRHHAEPVLPGLGAQLRQLGKAGAGAQQRVVKDCCERFGRQMLYIHHTSSSCFFLGLSWIETPPPSVRSTSFRNPDCSIVL